MTLSKSAQLQRDLVEKEARRKAIVPKAEETVKRIENELEMKKAELSEAQRTFDSARKAHDKDIRMIKVRLAREVEKDRRNHKEWSDSELIGRFENGDLDYSLLTGNDHDADLLKRVQVAYAVCKPDLDHIKTPATIGKIARQILALNSGDGNDNGFWAIGYIKRPSRLLSSAKPSHDVENTEIVEENLRHELEGEAKQQSKSLSPEVTGLSRKRSLASAGVNGGATVSSVSATEDGYASPTEKRPKLE